MGAQWAGLLQPLRRLPAVRPRHCREPATARRALHPAERGSVKILGKVTPTPRWQQSYGMPYTFSGGPRSAPLLHAAREGRCAYSCTPLFLLLPR